MDEVIKLVRTYRVTTSLSDRLTLADEIFRRIEPDLRFFVFNSIAHDTGNDICQETLNAIAHGMGKFAGGTNKEFWAWCYRIARNKINDHLRKKASDRLQPMTEEELWQMMESSAQDAPMSPAIRHDLECVMKLLTASKPECNELLWRHYVIGLDYTEIAEERDLNYDNVRMKIGRCLEEVQSLAS